MLALPARASCPVFVGNDISPVPGKHAVQKLLALIDCCTVSEEWWQDQLRWGSEQQRERMSGLLKSCLEDTTLSSAVELQPEELHRGSVHIGCNDGLSCTGQEIYSFRRVPAFYIY